MESEKKEKKPTHQRAKGFIIGALSATAALGLGAFLFRKKEEDKDLDWVVATPEQLQMMLDKPESVVYFDNSRVLVGNSTSSELL